MLKSIKLLLNRAPDEIHRGSPCVVHGESADVEVGFAEVGVFRDESVPATANESVPCCGEFQPTWKVFVIIVIVIFASFQEYKGEQLVQQLVDRRRPSGLGLPTG